MKINRTDKGNIKFVLSEQEARILCISVGQFGGGWDNTPNKVNFDIYDGIEKILGSSFKYPERKLLDTTNFHWNQYSNNP